MFWMFWTPTQTDYCLNPACVPDSQNTHTANSLFHFKAWISDSFKPKFTPVVEAYLWTHVQPILMCISKEEAKQWAISKSWGSMCIVLTSHAAAEKTRSPFCRLSSAKYTPVKEKWKSDVRIRILVREISRKIRRGNRCGEKRIFQNITDMRYWMLMWNNDSEVKIRWSCDSADGVCQ